MFASFSRPKVAFDVGDLSDALLRLRKLFERFYERALLLCPLRLLEECYLLRLFLREEVANECSLALRR